MPTDTWTVTVAQLQIIMGPAAYFNYESVYIIKVQSCASQPALDTTHPEHYKCLLCETWRQFYRLSIIEWYN